ncbi:hypothetical protein CAEBREN_21226 [Caenorhabditis brenneri]|uniref:F-box domain-containing protein n=1 Tax=Caenorhabditis brenneri TaxID=135651 RepID=G0N7S4_CAEBE|nr:hypothetical protein CAEBREN_21226 [Caenorhabditis brenneri]
MTVLSKNWGDLPEELKIAVILRLDIPGRIKLARTSKEEKELVDECKPDIVLPRVDLKIRNGYSRWMIIQPNRSVIETEYLQLEDYVFIRPVGSTKNIPSLNDSTLDECLQNLCRIVMEKNITISTFRLFMTADDRDYTADTAKLHFNVLCNRFGEKEHKLKVKRIEIDYSHFTVYEEDMLRGLNLLDPETIETIVITGDEAGAILNCRDVLECDVWMNCRELICSPSIRQMESFWDKPIVRTGLLVENGDFMPRLIRHLQTKTELKEMIIEVCFIGNEMLEEGDLSNMLLFDCPISDHLVINEAENQRHYTIDQPGHHLRLEVWDIKIEFTVQENQ